MYTTKRYFFSGPLGLFSNLVFTAYKGLTYLYNAMKLLTFQAGSSPFAFYGANPMLFGRSQVQVLA
jgi:hypothetical protein